MGANAGAVFSEFVTYITKSEQRCQPAEATPKKLPSRLREQGTKKLPSRLREGLGEGLSLPKPRISNLS